MVCPITQGDHNNYYYHHQCFTTTLQTTLHQPAPQLYFVTRSVTQNRNSNSYCKIKAALACSLTILVLSFEGELFHSTTPQTNHGTYVRSSQRQHCQISYRPIRCERQLLYILLKAVFTIAYGLLVHFVTCIPRRLGHQALNQANEIRP